MLRQLEFRDRLVALAAVPLMVVAVVAVGLLLFVDSPGTTAYGLFSLVGLLAAGGWVYLLATGIVASLDELTASAEALAEAQAKLAEGELVAGELPTIEVAGTGHLSRLAGSINAVSTAAAEVAETQRGAVKQGLANIVVNLARRSQTLLDRQVEYLDKLESSEEDPERLGELFKVDHLATRMRRNAESLLVLAAAEPGRRRGAPVEIGDVLRVAMGEVENYQRIELGKVADGEVSAGVAVDLAHLVAELMENAAQFSPPNAPVEVTGRMRRGPDRYEVSIADGGMGLGDKLEGANELLANPPELGLGMGRSLGFMVIGRLAERLGATVTLEAKQDGGTIAVVSIPTSLFLSSGRAGAKGRGKAAKRRARKSQAAPAPEEPKEEAKSPSEDPVPEPEPATGSTETATGSTEQPAAASTTLEKLLGLNASVLDRANDVDAAPDDWASTSPFGDDETGDIEPDDIDEDDTAGDDADTWTPPNVTPAPPDKLAEAVPTGEAFEDGVASLLLEEPEDGDAPTRGLRDDHATSAGLQKRQRGASKVPIGEGRPVAASTRNPDEVRSMLSRYREGLMGGKQDAREDAADDGASAEGTETKKGRKGAR